MNRICVIIPIYNSEKYLNECLESVFNQTYSQYDVFLIDDESTDNSLKICKIYKQKYNNCYIFKGRHKGPANARNIGIDEAFKKKKYSWLAFIDSDDVVSPNYLSILIKGCEKYNTKIGIVKFRNSTNFDSTYLDGVMPSIWLFENRRKPFSYNPMSPHHKLFAISLFEKNTRFPLRKFAEDAFIIPQIILSVEKISFADAYLYFYRYRSDNLTHSVFDLSKFDEFEAICTLIDYFLKKEQYQAAQFLITRIFVLISRYLYNLKHKWKKLLNRKMYIKKLRKLRLDYLVKYNSKWDLESFNKIYKIFKFRYNFEYFFIYYLFKRRL